MARPFFVEIGRLNRQVKKVQLNGDRTLADALDAADETLESGEIALVGGERVEFDDEVENGAFISIVPASGTKLG